MGTMCARRWEIKLTENFNFFSKMAFLRKQEDKIRLVLWVGGFFFILPPFVEICTLYREICSRHREWTWEMEFQNEDEMSEGWKEEDEAFQWGSTSPKRSLMMFVKMLLRILQLWGHEPLKLFGWNWTAKSTIVRLWKLSLLFWKRHPKVFFQIDSGPVFQFSIRVFQPVKMTAFATIDFFCSDFSISHR